MPQRSAASRCLPWCGLALALLLAACALTWAAQPTRPSAGLPPQGAGWLLHGVLAGGDTLSHDYPAYWWGWRQVREAGRLPLWNPCWLGGLPFLASQSFMPFYPPNWLGALLPFPLAFNIQYPLHLLLAGLAMAWAVRVRRGGWFAAVVAALAFGLGNHLATLAGPGHLQKLQTLAWLPVTATGLAELARSCRGAAPAAHAAGRRGRAALALGLTLQLAAGHPQALWLALLAGGLEGLLIFCLLMLRPGTSHTVPRRLAAGESPRYALPGAATARPARPVWRATGRLLLGLTLAAGLGAAIWLPLAEFAPLSNRGAGLTWEEQTRGSLPPEEALEFILPRLRGDSMPHGRGAYLGRYGEAQGASPERIVSDYAGAAALLFALLGLALPRRRTLAALGWLLAALGLTLSLGKYTPGLYHTLQMLLPGLAGFRSPSTSMALLAWGLALAASAGADGAVALVRGPAGARRLLLAATAVALAVAWGTATYSARQAEALGVQNFLLGPQALSAASLRLSALAQTSLGLAGVLGAAFAALLAAELQSPALRRVTLGAAVAGLLLAQGTDQLRNARVFWNAEPLAPYQAYLTQHWALARWAREDAPVRYWEPGNELSNRALTLADFQRFRQIGSIGGYHPVGYQRYFDLVGRLGFGSLTLQRLFAVNYLLWPADRPVPAGWHEEAREGGRLLLYNPEVAYVRPVQHMQAVPDWQTVLDRLAQPGFSPYESTAVTNDLLDPRHHNASGSAEPMGLQWRALVRGPGEIELKLGARRKGTIVVAEPAVPGWRVYLNDQRAQWEPQPVDGYFISLPVPAGRTTVLLRYDPVSQRLGLYLTLLTLGLLSAAAGQGAARRWQAHQARRRARRQPQPLDFTSSPGASAS